MCPQQSLHSRSHRSVIKEKAVYRANSNEDLQLPWESRGEEILKYFLIECGVPELSSAPVRNREFPVDSHYLPSDLSGILH